MTMRTRVKVCGLTRVEDAALAVSLGADALGFILWPSSPRATTPEAVRAITRELPALPVRVGVFVNASPTEVARAVEIAGLDVAQLHGDERVEDYRDLAPRVIKSVHLTSDESVAAAEALPSAVVPLVDAVDVVRRGGTGEKADWTLAARLAAKRPILLAGGLTPENVAAAVRGVRPWGVDVSSGIEDRPGIKNADRMRAFFRSVRDGKAEDE